LDRESVLRYLGYPANHEPPQRLDHLIDSSMESAVKLIRLQGAVRFFAPERAPEVGLEARRAEALAVGLVTIGLELETEVGNLLERGETTSALILDAIGSAVVENAADRFAADVRGCGRRLVPGCGAWPLEAQRDLFNLLSEQDVGVELTPELMMRPRKSSSFAVWLGIEGSDEEQRCHGCGFDGCRHHRDIQELVEERT